MKQIFIILGALLLSTSTFLVLSYLLNQAAEQDKSVNNEPYIEFIDLDNENPECEFATQQIKALLNEPQPCETAYDCTFASFGCPFGCSSTVNTDHKSIISSLIIKRNQVCSIQCNYRCSAQSVEKIPACINNLCSSVEAIDAVDNIRKFIDQNSPIENN
jgi:hypothetical protein